MPSIAELLALKKRVEPMASSAGQSAKASENVKKVVVLDGTNAGKLSQSGTIYQAQPEPLAQTPLSQSGKTFDTLAERNNQSPFAKQIEPSNLEHSMLADGGAVPRPLVEPASASEPEMSERSEPCVPKFAEDFLDELREMASQQDYEDVEQSANSLAEILNVVLSLPYTPDVFIDECVDNAAQALDNQKRIYIQRVLSGEKQSGARNRKKATAVAMKVDLSNDDLFVLGTD